jgi:peptidyl-prolyl cis-trans isomerase D
MLDKIRKASDNLIFRVILLVIIVAFGIWGVKDMLGTGNNFSVVTFNNADSIKYDDFWKAKMMLIKRLQAMNNVVLSEDEIKQYRIDEEVINQLVTQRLVAQLVQDFDIDFSSDILASIIKQIPSFQNKDGRFDSDLFKSTATHFGLTEDQYITQIKGDQSQRILLNTLISSYHVPKIVENNIIDFLSEERVVDIVSIDLNSSKYAELEKPTQEILENFYNENSALFTVPEKRSIDYIVIGENNVKHLISVTDSEINRFFNDNQSEFSNKKLDMVKAQVTKAFISRRTEELLSELMQNLQDEIAAGSSLAEIAQKFELKVKRLNAVTAGDIVEIRDIGSLVDTIFSSGVDEVSYPVELSDVNKFAIFDVKNITPSKVQDFAEVADGVLKQWQNHAYNERNLKLIKDFVSKAQQETFASKAAEMNLSFQSAIKLKRADIENNVQFPPEMLQSVFTNRPNIVSAIYNSGDKAYAMVVRQISHNAVTKKDVIKNSGKKIIDELKNGFVDELILYMYKKENVRKNSKFLSQENL